jgi:hypothetical protein
MVRGLIGIGWHAGVVREILAHGGPAAIIDEEIIEPGKTVAVTHREIAGLSSS